MLVAVNTLTATLGVVALGTYVLLYTPLKRHTCLALLIGAIPGAMPPLMGWTAATGTLLSSSVSGGASSAAGMGGVLLFLLLFVWQLPHFIAIAYFRAEDYARAGLKVVPVERGERAAKGQIAFYAVLLVGVSFAIAAARMAGTAYLLASVALGAIFLALAGYGFRAESGRGWAKSVFAYSVVYLTVLLGILVVDRAGV
jgi:protoheme IX farnesyltransferase